MRIPELARRLGVVQETLYAWRRKLGTTPAEGAAGTRPSIVRVRVRVVGDDAGDRKSAPLELRLSTGRCVLVPRGFDPDSLVALVEVLEKC